MCMRVLAEGKLKINLCHLLSQVRPALVTLMKRTMTLITCSSYLLAFVWERTFYVATISTLTMIRLYIGEGSGEYISNSTEAEPSKRDTTVSSCSCCCDLIILSDVIFLIPFHLMSLLGHFPLVIRGCGCKFRQQTHSYIHKEWRSHELHHFHVLWL